MTNNPEGVWTMTDTEFKRELARAWNEGFTACAQQHTKQRNDPSHPITRVNRYNPNLDWPDMPRNLDARQT